MKKTLLALTFILSVAIAGGLYWNWKQTNVIKDQQRMLERLTSKMASDKSTVQQFNFEERCAKQAGEDFKQWGWDKKGPTVVSGNHYNQKLNRCFMLIEDNNIAGLVQTKTLVDVFEGKTLGFYMWRGQKDKKYWEVPPSWCEVTLPSGEKKVCKSGEEFDELVKVYME
jgi:hypothetical protein